VASAMISAFVIVAVMAATASVAVWSTEASRRPENSNSKNPTQSRSRVASSQNPRSCTHDMRRAVNGPIMAPKSSVIDTWPSSAG